MTITRADTDRLVVEALLDGGVRIPHGSGEYRLLVQPNLFGGVDLVWRGRGRPRPGSSSGRRPRRRSETHPDLFDVESALRSALTRPRSSRRWRECYGLPASEASRPARV